MNRAVLICVASPKRAFLLIVSPCWGGSPLEASRFITWRPPIRPQSSDTWSLARWLCSRPRRRPPPRSARRRRRGGAADGQRPRSISGTSSLTLAASRTIIARAASLSAAVSSIRGLAPPTRSRRAAGTWSGGSAPTNSYVRRSSAAGSRTQRSNWSTSTRLRSKSSKIRSSCALYRLRARDSLASMAPKYSRRPRRTAWRTIASSCLSPDWRRCRGSLSRTRILASGAALRRSGGIQNPCMYSGDHSPVKDPRGRGNSRW